MCSVWYAAPVPLEKMFIRECSIFLDIGYFGSGLADWQT